MPRMPAISFGRRGEVPQMSVPLPQATIACHDRPMIDGRAGDGSLETEKATGAGTAQLRTATTLVVVAIAYAAAAHGAFYARELAVVVVLVGIALIAAASVAPLGRADLGAPAVAAMSLAAWYLVAGLIAGHPAGALPAVALLFAMAAIVAVVRRADTAEREVLVLGVLAVGTFVALVGWAGVAWRSSPRAIADGGLWRAASTITYSNVTGSLTAALGLVALDACRRRPRWYALLAFALLTGACATASRGALIGLGVGTLVLVALQRRHFLAAAAPVVLGTLIATTALLPSMPATHHARPFIALLGLTAGAIVAVLPLRAVAACAAAIAVVILVVPGPRNATADAWRPIKDGRFTTSSPDRTHELHAALHVAGDHPVVGVGPGNVDLRWNVVYLVRLGFHVHYVHDEYVQVLVEAGAIGLAIALAGLAAVVVTLWSARRSIDTAYRAGITAALVAFAAQSATDFLWHVPIVPLTAAVLVGLLSPERDRYENF
ncbi:MAG: hypothetical protein JWL83_101 [Actinomycetia bacterium]|nr:hypothetical protein [Actinomycetes bacterium]